MDSLINTARRARAAHRLLAVLALGLALGASPAGAYAEMRDTDAICGRTYTEETRETEDRPDIACQEAIVMGKDGTVYFERDADKEVKIASITKVMTAIVVLENTSADDELVVGHRAATVGQSSADLREGDVLTRDEALKALMIPSGNDAAMALATFTGSKIDPASSDPYQVFIDAMNAKAQELGMDHSVFANPHGLDFDGWEGDFHSTARDVATMFAHAMEDETFRELTANPDNQITVTSADGTERTIDMVERNKILGTESNIGGKTGGTYEALQCFVGAFQRDAGGEIYTVTLGSDGDQQRWDDTLALANWYYGHVVAYPIAPTTRTCGDGMPLVAKAPHADWSDKTVDITVEHPDQTVDLFSLAGDVELELDLAELHGDVKTGDAAGTIRVMQNGAEVGQGVLVCAEDLAAPAGFDWVMVQLDRLFRLMSGRPGTAEVKQYAAAINAHDFDMAS